MGDHGPDNPDDDPIVVRTFVNNFEAEIAKTALEAADIQSIIRADDCGGVRPHLWMGGIELLVRRGDFQRADEVLGNDAEPFSEVPPAEEGEG
jgi:hypothetical protein